MMELIFFRFLNNCKLSCVPSGIANAAQRGEYGEQVGFAYDITSIAVGFLSARGQYKSIQEVTSIRGNEIEAIIRGYSVGAESVNTATGTYYLIKQ